MSSADKLLFINGSPKTKLISLTTKYIRNIYYRYHRYNDYYEINKNPPLTFAIKFEIQLRKLRDHILCTYISITCNIHTPLQLEYGLSVDYRGVHFAAQPEYGQSHCSEKRCHGAHNSPQ